MLYLYKDAFLQLFYTLVHIYTAELYLKKLYFVLNKIWQKIENRDTNMGGV